MSYAAKPARAFAGATSAPGAIPVAALVALAVFAVAILSIRTLGDGDSWWHVTAGQWILAQGEIPHADPFSLTMAGAPWTAHEWLAEVLLALAFRAAGWSGVMLLTGACAGLSAFIVCRHLARFLEGPALVIVALLGLGLIAPGLLARPHLLALPCLALWVVGLMRAREADRVPSPWLTLLMALWANLHGGFALGLALIGPFALEALLLAAPGRRKAVVVSWFGFGLLASSAALLTPHGLEGLLFPFKLLGMQSLANIGEWRPADFGKLGVLELALLALLALALTRPLRVAPVRLLLLLGLLHLALSHMRHQTILGIIAPLLLAEPIARALGQEPAPQSAERRVPPLWQAAVVALCAALVAARLAMPVVRSDNPSTPMTALAAVPDSLKGQPVLNSYDFGGYLISLGVRPFIDGRTDLYGDEMMARYMAITTPRPEALDGALDRYKIAWTIFNPTEPVVGLLDRRPGWRRLYADPFAVVHVREGATPSVVP